MMAKMASWPLPVNEVRAVAVRLGRLFGNGAALWVRMQGAYDTWHAEREVDVSGIPTLAA